MLEFVHRSQPRTVTVINSESSRSGRARGVEENPFVALERMRRKYREYLADGERERHNKAFHAAAKAAAEAVGLRRRTCVRIWVVVSDSGVVIKSTTVLKYDR